jgi:peroxiredoxin
VVGWRRRGTWFLLIFSGVAALLSLGPLLHVIGEERWTLPGTWVARLPLLEHATPQRFTAYMAIGVAVLLADWLARARAGRDAALRFGLVGLGALLLLPDLSSPPYHPVIAAPTAITSGGLATVLGPDPVVYAIPERQGEELLWQVASDQRFRLAQGYLGPIPIPYRGLVAARGLGLDHPNTRMPTPGDFARYLADRGTSTVVVDAAARPLFRVLLEAMGWVGTPLDDLWIYRPGPEAVVPGGAPLVDVQPFVVGRLAPPVALAALDGGAPVSVVPGRATVLTFVASWCLDGCRDHVEGLRNLVAADPDLDVIAVAMSDDPASASSWFASLGLPLRVGLDPDGILFLGTGSARIPTTVVIDATGIVRRIIATPIDPDAFPAAIEDALGR